MAEQLIKCSEKDPRDIYKLLIGCVGPRPIGWISTISASGVPNLAPFSFFNMFSMNPAVLGFSAALRRDASPKDSLINVKETQCFVHNVVTKDLLEPMNASSEEFPHGISEFEKVGLTAAKSELIPAPRVQEAAINIECKLIDIVSFGSRAGNGQLVLGEVVLIHINHPEVLAPDGFIDSSKLYLLGRLGRTEYMDYGKAFSKPRP